MVRVTVAVGIVVLIVAGFLLFRDTGLDPEPPRPRADSVGSDLEVSDVVAGEPGVKLRGRVLLPNDTPVPDATVHLTNATPRKTAAIDAVRTGPDGRRVAAFKWSFDERVEDGLYCARSLERLQDLLSHPEKL